MQEQKKGGLKLLGSLALLGSMKEAGFFKKRLKVGDNVVVKKMFLTSGPARIIDKSNDMDRGFGTKMHPSFLCQFEDGSEVWHPVTSFDGW